MTIKLSAEDLNQAVTEYLSARGFQLTALKWIALDNGRKVDGTPVADFWGEATVEEGANP